MSGKYVYVKNCSYKGHPYKNQTNKNHKDIQTTDIQTTDIQIAGKNIDDLGKGSLIIQTRQGRITLFGALFCFSTLVGELAALTLGHSFSTLAPLLLLIGLCLFLLSIWRGANWIIYSIPTTFLLGYLVTASKLPSVESVFETGRFLARECGGKELRFDGCRLTIRGQIWDQPTILAGDRLNIELEMPVGEQSKRIRVNLIGTDLPWLSNSELSPGDTLELVAEVRPTQIDSACPAIFSREGYLFRHGVLLDGQIENISEINRIQAIKRSNPEWSFAERFLAAFAESRGSALIASSSLGVNGLLDSDTLNLFRRTGTSHLVVVSGNHVGLIFNLTMRAAVPLVVAILPFFRMFVGKVIIDIVSLIGTGLFLLVVELGIPTLRAGIAFALYSLIGLRGRRQRSWRCFIVVFLLTILLFPGCFLDCGVQLTFLAVAGLILSGKLIRSNKSINTDEDKKSSPWINAVVANSCVIILTAPITTAWFQTAVPLSLCYNLICVIPFTVTVILAGGAGMIGWGIGIPFADTLVSWTVSIIQIGLRMLTELERYFSALGLGVYRVESGVGGVNWGWNFLSVLAVQILLPATVLLGYFILEGYITRKLPNNRNCGRKATGLVLGC